MIGLSSRERLLRALSCQPVDYPPPCCFMLLHTLDEWYPGEPALIAAQADWGLDPLVVLPSWSPTRSGDPRDLRGYQFDYPGKVNVTLRGLPVHRHPDVRLREWREIIPGARYPVLHREYRTPAGPLSVSANQTEDWPYGDRLLFVDDFIIARARKPLVTKAADLKALAYLLQPPDAETRAYFHAASRANQELARKRDLLRVYRWGVLADMAVALRPAGARLPDRRSAGLGGGPPPPDRRLESGADARGAGGGCRPVGATGVVRGLRLLVARPVPPVPPAAPEDGSGDGTRAGRQVRLHPDGGRDAAARHDSGGRRGRADQRGSGAGGATTCAPSRRKPRDACACGAA